jgi:hypothetical protein
LQQPNRQCEVKKALRSLRSLGWRGVRHTSQYNIRRKLVAVRSRALAARMSCFRSLMQRFATLGMGNDE